MFDGFVGNSVWQLLHQSDFLSKFVMLVLLGTSILCWTVFLCKLILVRMRKKDLNNALKLVAKVRSVHDLTLLATHLEGTVPGALLSQSLLYLTALVEVKTSHASDVLQYHIDQIVDTLISDEEAYLTVLSTSAGVAPLLGLFGTVWGLIHAFIRISEKQSADIVVVAPGIAEALLTTLAGLIVAIPAFVMYNYTAVQVRKIEGQIVQFADKISFVMQQLIG